MNDKLQKIAKDLTEWKTSMLKNLDKKLYENKIEVNAGNYLFKVVL